MRSPSLEHQLALPEGAYVDRAPIVPGSDVINAVLGPRLVGSTKYLADSYNRSPKRIGMSGIVQYDDYAAGFSTFVYIGEQAANARPDGGHIASMHGDAYLSGPDRSWSSIAEEDGASERVRNWANTQERIAQLSPVTFAARPYEQKGIFASRERRQIVQSLDAFTAWTMTHPYAITLRRHRPVTTIVDTPISEPEIGHIPGFESRSVLEDNGVHSTQISVDSATLASHLLSNDHDPSGLLMSGLGDRFYELATYEHAIDTCEARLQEPQNGTPQDEIERAVAEQALNDARLELTISSHTLVVQWQERNTLYEAAKREAHIRAVFNNTIASLAETVRWHPETSMLQTLIYDVADLCAQLDPADPDSLRTMQRLGSQLQGSLTRVSDPNGLEALRVQLVDIANAKAAAIEAASDSQPDLAES